MRPVEAPPKWERLLVDGPLSDPHVIVQIPAVRELVEALNECSATWQFGEVLRPWIGALEANSG